MRYLNEFEKQINDALNTFEKIFGSRPIVISVDVLKKIVKNAKKDIESNATLGSQKLMIIDRKKWIKWFGK